MVPLQEIPKHKNGSEARRIWAKSIPNSGLLSITEFNNICGEVFEKSADIIIDSAVKRQTVIACQPYNCDAWKNPCENVYVIVRNGYIMKIGGSRTSMKDRFTSYLCGHQVTERGKSGKMSVTNAHIYHSIESDLLSSITRNKWEFYVWKLPVVSIEVDIFEEKTTIIAQTFHAYETKCIKKYQKHTGKLPPFCDNCDPEY